jgi:hypothetical protein
VSYFLQHFEFIFNNRFKKVLKIKKIYFKTVGHYCTAGHTEIQVSEHGPCTVVDERWGERRKETERQKERERGKERGREREREESKEGERREVASHRVKSVCSAQVTCRKTNMLVFFRKENLD